MRRVKKHLQGRWTGATRAASSDCSVDCDSTKGTWTGGSPTARLGHAKPGVKDSVVRAPQACRLESELTSSLRGSLGLGAGT